MEESFNQYATMMMEYVPKFYLISRAILVIVLIDVFLSALSLMKKR